MAKTYAFLFQARQAEFKDAIVTMVLGGPETVYAREDHQMTFARAQEYLSEFTAKQTKDCVCSYLCRDTPKPPGYHKAARQEYRWVTK